MKNPNIKITLILCLILNLALVLRLCNLTTKPLWYDEADSVACAQKPLDYFFGQPHTFNYKILYFLILKAWIRMFGTSELSVRSLSVIFGVLSIFLIHRLALILFNRKVAVLSSFFLSISTFHIYHSQQVRYHSLILTLAILSFYLFIRLLYNKKNSLIPLNILVNFLLLITHPYTILIILTQFIYICHKMFKSTSRVLLINWIFLQIFGLLLYLLFFLVPSFSYLQEKVWWIPKNHFSILYELFFTFLFGGSRYGFDDYIIPREALIYPTAFSFIFLFLFYSGIISARKRKENLNQEQAFHYQILLCWFFIPIITAFLVSYIKPLFLIKHLIYVLPPFLILIAKGIESVGSVLLKICSIILLAMLSFFSLKILYSYDGHINWRHPAEYIYKNLSLDDVIAICASKEVVPFLYYFDYGNKDKLKTLDIYGKWDEGDWQKVFKYNNVIIIGLRQQRPGEPPNPFKDFSDKYAENKLSWRDKNIWLAKSRWCCGGNSENPFYKIEKKLSENHLKVIEKKFYGVTLWYWKRM